MRRKPSASHCVKRPPPLVYRPDSSVFLSGAQVLRISSVKLLGRRRAVDDELAVLVAERHALAVGLHAQQGQALAVQAQRPAAGRRRCARCCSRLATMVLAGSRSKLSSTSRIQ